MKENKIRDIKNTHITATGLEPTLSEKIGEVHQYSVENPDERKQDRNIRFFFLNQFTPLSNHINIFQTARLFIALIPLIVCVCAKDNQSSHTRKEKIIYGDLHASTRMSTFTGKKFNILPFSTIWFDNVDNHGE